VTRYGIGATRVASAMLLTLPGMPSLYAGEETGAAFEPYNDIAPLPRDDPHGLRSWYAQLIALRHTYPALRSSNLEFVDSESAGNVLAYIRRAPKGSDDLLILLNYADGPANIPLPPEFRMHGLRDVAAGDVLPGARNLTLPAYGVRVLKKE
jgi:cyclomaltodextrinase